MSGQDKGTPGFDTTLAALDRIDAALARIAMVQRRTSHESEPEWARDVATRLDALIGELRRALAGEG